MPFLPLQKMWERFRISIQDSDAAAFLDLMCLGELIAKTTVLGLAAALQQDKDRHQYGFLHRLVRADGIGEWDQTLQQMLTGSAAHLLRPEALVEAEELRMRVDTTSWQYEAIAALHKSLKLLKPKLERLPEKVDGRRWFSMFAELRNCSPRGHGAPPASVLGKLTPPLKQSLQVIGEHFTLFSRPWAYVRRSLSGRYLFTPLCGSTTLFETHNVTDHSLIDGVYCYMGGPLHVPLIQSTPEAFDFFYHNGAFREKSFEFLSYITGTTAEGDASLFLEPPTQLPASETQGLGTLAVYGKTLSNLPLRPRQYVRREELETELQNELTDKERHPVVTLLGRGGIGKTSLALTVLGEMADRGDYPVILWFSARDIDLLPDRPLPVAPNVVTKSDIAKEFTRLTEPANRHDKSFRPSAWFEDCLRKPELGPTLFVFDNFETMQQPLDVFRWIDVNVRSPNKVLITTRHRDFKGDYPIEVDSMTREQCDELIMQTARNLGIGSWITKDYQAELFAEAAGHPYVIKIILGEAKKAGRRTKIDRIPAVKDQILDALFDRTYARLSPAARRTFLTLSNWGTAVPELAVEAVLLQAKYERLDVTAAIEELILSSFIARNPGHDGATTVIEIPLVAAIFGRKKLAVEPMKIEVDEDTELLRVLVSLSGDAGQSVVERIIKNVARQSAAGTVQLEDMIPLLEYISTKIPDGWLFLSQLHEESGHDQGFEGAKGALKRYLQMTKRLPLEQRQPWERLATLCERTDDFVGCVDALASLCELPGMELYHITNAALRLISIVSKPRYKSRTLETKVKVKQMIPRIIERMGVHYGECTAVDFTRLAWMSLHVGDIPAAEMWTKRGLAIEPDNVYCLRLAQRLDMQPPRSNAARIVAAHKSDEGASPQQHISELLPPRPTLEPPLRQSQVRLRASPQDFRSGESITLFWEVSGGAQVSIDNGIGKVAPIGQLVVTPLQTTGYTLTATLADGRTESARVVVRRKIRVNELARELEIKAHDILDALPELGCTEKKTHSSTIPEEVADRVRLRFGTPS
jgi:hypothetical protein